MRGADRITEGLAATRTIEEDKTGAEYRAGNRNMVIGKEKTDLDAVDHVAIPVEDIAAAVAWYTKQFKCSVDYQDESWAFLKFDNIRLALVIPSQHPAHLAFKVSDAEQYGKLESHRDGTRSVYVKDPAGNAVELLDSKSTPADKVRP